jgi:signal transduction histidine kinase
LSRGTGLGLVIAREAAERLGSELTLESVPGVGTTLVFTVPDAEHP